MTNTINLSQIYKYENLNLNGTRKKRSGFYHRKEHGPVFNRGKKTASPGNADVKNMRAPAKFNKKTGLKEDSPYNNMTYESLGATNPSAYNRLNDSVLRAFIVKQMQPKDNASIYHIFERLNTGGTQLQGQEIRNCIYYGKFNDMIIRLNKNNAWRKIFGSPIPNKHKRDEELILRFFHYMSNMTNIPSQ
jgi:hypothetical protein